MTTTSALASPTLHSATAVAEHLATGYIALSGGAIIAEQLVAADDTYRGTAGWDLQMAIMDACTAVENAACVRELGAHHRFPDNPRTRSSPSMLLRRTTTPTRWPPPHGWSSSSPLCPPKASTTSPTR
jgi:hypothetical protein